VYVNNDWIRFTGDEVPPSTFSMTNMEEWDRFRNIDMDKEVIFIILLFVDASFEIFNCLRKQIGEPATAIGSNMH